MFKQKELALVIGVAVFAALFSFILSDALFGSPKKHPIKVPVVDKISPSFPDVKNDPSYKTIFNDQALNPTQLIQIGNNNNTTPFQQTNNQ